MTADLRRNPANQCGIPCSDGSIKSQIKGSACTYVLYVMEYSYSNSIHMLTGVGVLQFSTHPSFPPVFPSPFFFPSTIANSTLVCISNVVYISHAPDFSSVCDPP